MMNPAACGTRRVIACSSLLARAREPEHMVPSLSQPAEIAHFSVCEDGSVDMKYKSELRSYVGYWALTSTLPIDLSRGPRVEKKADAADLSKVLAAAVASGVDLFSFKVISFRNNWNKILLTPYELREGWRIGIFRRRGTLLFDVRHDPDQNVQNSPSIPIPSNSVSSSLSSSLSPSLPSATPSAVPVAQSCTAQSSAPAPMQTMTEAMNWGYRFEYVCTRKPSDPIPEVLNCNREFCTIVKTRLKNHRLLIGAEIDGHQRPALEAGVVAVPGDNLRDNAKHMRLSHEEQFKSSSSSPNSSSSSSIQSSENSQRAAVSQPVPTPSPSPTTTYVEMKTSRTWMNQQHEQSFWRHKALRYWVQSYLAGVPRIVCGFQNGAGLVERIVEFRTDDLPRSAWEFQRAMTKHTRPWWEKSVCLSFAAQLVDWLDRETADEHYYELSFDPQSMTLTLVDSRGSDSYSFEKFLSELK